MEITMTVRSDEVGEFLTKEFENLESKISDTISLKNYLLKRWRACVVDIARANMTGDFELKEFSIGLLEAYDKLLNAVLGI